MKQMFPFLLIVLSVFSFSGCEKIEGQLNISNDVKLVNTKGHSKILKVGTYNADIKANTNKKITLRLDNDSNEKYTFNVPDNSIPANGAFAVKSNVVGQPVDLTGTVSTVVTKTDRRQGYESCQYQEQVQVCFPTGPNGQVSCTLQTQIRFGTKWISYYDRRTEKDFSLSIMAQNTTVESAQFIGDIAWVDRIVLNETLCR